MARKYFKTASSLAAHIMVIDAEHRPKMVYVRLRANMATPLAAQGIRNYTFPMLQEYEQRPDFISFFIYGGLCR